MKKTYLISGAGVAGLTAAIWLGKAGNQVTVIEKSRNIRADGYIVSLSHKSFHFADQMGILPLLMQRYSGIKQSQYIDRKGKEMLRLKYQELFQGIDIVQVMRDELQMILYEEARQYVDFIFGDSIEQIENHKQGEGVSVKLKTDKEISADILIGADGLHSVTRNLCFSDSSYQRHYFGLFSAAYKLDNLLGLDKQFQNHMEHERYMCVYTTGKSDLACVFIWKDDAARAPEIENRPDVLKQAFANSPEIVRKVLSQCPLNKPIYMDPLIQIDMQNWYSRNVVLIGDAAHAMTLLSGQGASMAFWGASSLAQNLLKLPADQAFTAYQQILKPAVIDIQTTTQKAKNVYIPTSQSSYILRDSMMRYLPNTFFQYYFRKKYSRA